MTAAETITLRTCILCQSPFDSDHDNWEEEHKKKDFELLKKLSDLFSNPFSDEGIDFEEISAVVTCHECGPLVNSALAEKENVECVEKGVRKLQMELLQEMKYLQEAIHQFYEEMRTIDVVMEDVLTPVMMTPDSSKSKRILSGPGLEESDIFRSTVKQVLKELKLCENVLDNKTNVSVNPDVPVEVCQDQESFANADSKCDGQRVQNSANINNLEVLEEADRQVSNFVSIDGKSVIMFEGNRPSTSSVESQTDFREDHKPRHNGDDDGVREQIEPTVLGCENSFERLFRNTEEKQAIKELRLCDKCGDALDNKTSAKSDRTVEKNRQAMVTFSGDNNKCNEQPVQNSKGNVAREKKKAFHSGSPDVNIEMKKNGPKADPPATSSGEQYDHNADHEMDQISDGYSDRGEGESDGESESGSSGSKSSDESEDSETEDSESEADDKPKPRGRPRKKIKIEKIPDPFQDPPIDYTGMSSFKKYFISRTVARKKYIVRHGYCSWKRGRTKIYNVESPIAKYYIDYNPETDTLSLEDVIIHLEDKDENNEYLQCSKCAYRLTSSAARKKAKNDVKMIDHILGHHLQKYQCDRDGRIFNSNNSYMVHARAHFHADDDRFKCDICGRKMCSPESLAKHNFTHMNEEEKEQAIQSGFKYKTKKRYEGRPFQCSICGMSFGNPEGLKTHGIIHVDREQRSIICPVCGKSVLERTFRRSHSKICIPNNEKLPPVQCTKCPNVYKNIERMKDHLKKMHSEKSNERPCICQICGKAFKKNGDLKDHFKVHSDEKPFECGRGCGTCFKRKSTCKKHEETCKGIKDNKFQP